MSQIIEVKVPDIGDYKNIPVIEIFVKVGDTVAVEDSLLTLESDKATLDVPSSHAGIIKEIKVKVGDKISEGSIVVVLETSETTTTTATATTAQMATPATGVKSLEVLKPGCFKSGIGCANIGSDTSAFKNR